MFEEQEDVSSIGSIDDEADNTTSEEEENNDDDFGESEGYLAEADQALPDEEIEPKANNPKFEKTVSGVDEHKLLMLLSASK